jgi:hypothetical protein
MLLGAQALNYIDDIHPTAGAKNAINAWHLLGYFSPIALGQAPCCNQ